MIFPPVKVAGVASLAEIERGRRALTDAGLTLADLGLPADSWETAEREAWEAGSAG